MMILRFQDYRRGNTTNLFLVVNMFLVISIDYFIDYLHFNF